METNNLNILAVIGFNGGTIDGLVLHPDNEHILYPIGTQLIVRNVLTRQQSFLTVIIPFNILFIHRVTQIKFPQLLFLTMGNMSLVVRKLFLVLKLI